MPNWPPDPNKRPENSANQSTPLQQVPANQPSGQEWRLIEKTLLASVEEQRRSRRWSIFFKLLTFGYILLLFFTFKRLLG